jgi:hypothetical protein
MNERVQIPMRPAVAGTPALSRAPFGSVQRKCACRGPAVAGDGCADCKKKRQNLQRRAISGAAPTNVPPIVYEVLRSSGQPLDAATRAFSEPRFGHDFSKVRIHADAKAAESARAVNAIAYTVGRDVVFGPGQYTPHTPAGRQLLAHELAHTLQQGHGAAESTAPGQVVVGDPAVAAERDAESAAHAVLAGGQTSVSHQSAGERALRRQDAPLDAAPAPEQTQQADAGTPGTVRQAGGGDAGGGVAGGGEARGGGGGSSATMPTCQPQGLDRPAFLGTPGATTNDFGLTSLDTTAVTYPSLSTSPAKPRGVTVDPTAAALPTIPSVFTKNGTFVEGDATVIGGGERGCPSRKYPLRWRIATTKIEEGEKEHCNDYQFAFDISLKRYADAVNALASSGPVFPNDKAVDGALKRTTGVAPADWQSVFVCLAQKSLRRDPTTKGGPSWHTPRPTRLTPQLPRLRGSARDYFGCEPARGREAPPRRNHQGVRGKAADSSDPRGKVMFRAWKLRGKRGRDHPLRHGGTEFSGVSTRPAGSVALRSGGRTVTRWK